MSSILDGLKYEKVAKTRTTTNNTIFATIKASVNRVIHEHLLAEFPEYYQDCGNTEIVKCDKDGKVLDDGFVNGSNTYRLLIPIDDKVTLINGNNKKVLASACRVGNPTMYSQGIKNWVAEYVKINGKTHLWDREEGKFTTSKTK